MDQMQIIAMTRRLTAEVSAIVPIVSISIGIPENRSTWTVEHFPETNERDIERVQSVIDDFQVDDPTSNRATSDDIKAEARRRITAVMTEDQQRNALASAQSAMLQYGPDMSEWPEEFRARQRIANAAWAQIERIRSRSNELELIPITVPITTEDLWS